MPQSTALLTLGSLACLLVGTTHAAYADDRYFPFSYPYNTADQGERELELYTDGSGAGLENKLEFEYGLTDRLTLAAIGYVHNATQFDGWAVEGRYRLAEQNVLPVDLGIYAEAENAKGEGPTFEYKLLLEKTLGRWVIDSNLIGEHHFQGGDEFGATLAGGYFFDEDTIGGLEARYDADKVYIGPTLSKFWGSFHATGGVYYGGANEVLGRLALAQEF